MFEQQDRLKRMSAHELQAALASMTRPLVVLFTAAWSSPGAAAETMLCHLAGQYAGRVDVWAVDYDTAPALVAELGIRQLPCVVLWAAGREVFRHARLPARQELTARLTRLLNGQDV